MSDYIPKVGEECQIKIAGSWLSCDYVGKTRWGNGVVVLHDKSTILMNDFHELKPIKSARDKAIDEICESVSFPRAICASFYDAGYRKVKPLSDEVCLRLCFNMSSNSLYQELLKLGHIVSE